MHLTGSEARCIDDSGKSYSVTEGDSEVVPEAIASYYQHTLQVSRLFIHSIACTSVCVCVCVGSVVRSVSVWSK